MTKDNKIMIAIAAATIAIIGIGVYFLSKPPKSNEQITKKVNQELLVRPDSYKITAPNEKAVLVEFGDFQCPACASYHTLTKQLKTEFKDNLTYVFRNYPLSQHKYSRVSAFAAEAAGKQGKFWEMSDLLYENQNDWSLSTDAEAIFRDYAKTLGLDLTKYNTDVNSEDIKKRVERDYSDGNALGISSTPTFYLNAAKLGSIRGYDEFKKIVQDAMSNSDLNITEEEKYHAHFDLGIYLSGKAVDLSLDKYQDSDKNKLDPNAHFHDGNGKVIHLHKKGVTLGEFFKSLKMELTTTCFTLDSGVKNCNSGTKLLKMFVNGSQNSDFEKYVPQDLDRVLVTFGSETEKQIQTQIDSVSDDSCIYSLKCPGRGKPPVENCVGGVGSGCDEL